MIKDGRSGKVIFLAHCIINSNSICLGPKTPSIWPAMIDEVVELLMEKKVGIVQLPCPEQAVFGLVRESKSREEMDTPSLRDYCRELARSAANLMEEYARSGFKVVGFLGKRGSPTCNVLENRGLRRGVFVEALERELKDRALKIPLLDFERTDVKGCLSKLGRLIEG
ncbi:TPA: hypothetical protein EYP26_03140 [Candidatus Bathyarchaeota archaeon]|nr:hypothetical protein [Candidatus Bathyarchaeota archaeon]